MIIVVLLCGPPGVGKSTVAKMLMQMIQERSDDDEQFRVQSRHLEFDTLQTDRDMWDEHSFRASRDEGILQLQRMITSSTAAVDKSNGVSHLNHTVVIVDDIMYLHSMRRAVYVATRDLLVRSLITVRVTANLTASLSRNSLREDSRRMSDETVTRIYNQFEELNTSLVHERVSTTVDTSTEETCSIGVSSLMNLIESTLRVRSEASSTTTASTTAKATTSTSAVVTTTNTSCGNDSDKAQVSSSKTSKNNYSVSSVDLELRKVISALMSFMGNIKGINKYPEARAKVSLLISRSKVQALDAVRTGSKDDFKEGNDYIRFFFSLVKCCIEKEAAITGGTSSSLSSTASAPSSLPLTSPSSSHIIDLQSALATAPATATAITANIATVVTTDTTANTAAISDTDIPTIDLNAINLSNISDKDCLCDNDLGSPISILQIYNGLLQEIQNRVLD